MLPQISLKKPLVWTIHDMWPLTGHCYNPLDCECWREGCGKCPDMKSYIRLLVDTTGFMVSIKRRVVQKSRMTVVCPSIWMKGLVEASPVFSGKDIRCIPNGIDTDLFRPFDRSALRLRWGIPESKQVILFVASQVDDPRKGYSYFLEALSRLTLPKQQLLVLTMGSGKFPAEGLSGIPVKSLGFLSDELRMAEVYALADVLVMPSLQENLPNIVLESLACGTPVVCFDNSGQKEIVKHRENGYLASLNDAADLASGIAFVLKSPYGGHHLRETARKTVVDGFSLNNMVEAHVKLYSELCDHWKGI